MENPVPGMDYAGGMEFHFPFGTVRAKNITPDEKTGVGRWTKELFFAKFRKYAGPEARNMPLDSTGFNTPMPLTMFAGMTDKDIGAIYEYLRVVPPVRNKIEMFTSIK